MKISTLILALAAVLISAGGQVCLKAGANKLGSGSGAISLIIGAMQQYQIIAGIALWGISTVVWIIVLNRAPLSIAYPLNSLNYLIVPLLGLFLFDEAITRPQIAGFVMIVSGVLMVLRG